MQLSCPKDTAGLCCRLLCAARPPLSVEKTEPLQVADRISAENFAMENKQRMIAEARLFLRLGTLSFLGFLFYYAHLYFGLLENVVLFKALAITFLLATVPLPIIAVNSKKLFPELSKNGKKVLTFATAMLLFHHFLMTFIFVMFLKGDTIF